MDLTYAIAFQSSRSHYKTEILNRRIDLHALLDLVYDRAGFEVAIDYTQAPIPSLEAGDIAWCEEVLIAQDH
jgi:Protein of unknown function (DUF4058)